MENDLFSYIPRPETGRHIEGRAFFISADLGQANDYTAISIIERIITGYGVIGMHGRGERTYHLRHIERPARGTEYPAIVDRLIEIYRSEPLKRGRKATVIDLTGLGRPVFDMMRAAGFSHSLNAISITGGNTVTRDGCISNVPKRDLVTNLQVLLQNNQLRIAKGMKEGEALVSELANFQVKITDNGHDVYGARSGMHDDIVLSVAIGAWLATARGCNMGWGKEL